MNAKIMYLVIPLLMILAFITTLNLMYNKMIMINISILNYNSMILQMNIMTDWMSVSFTFTVLIISSFIAIYSLSYINKKEHLRFMLTTLLFIMSMVTLISSNNLILLLVGWDGLGLTSYILVIYYQNASTNASGTITILSNRVGDIMLMMAFAGLSTNMNWSIFYNNKYSLLILIMMLVAAISKSAQFPFSAWLPAAMAAPTPISALVHSSTLVTAGVYLMIRLSNSFHKNTMALLMILAFFSILMSSMAAMWEQDMKKIIALSTLSQIALMMFSIAINAKTAAFFHMITHAMFKSTMFLCAGNMIHSSTYQDMRTMGSLYKKTPLLSTTLGISTMALMGLPFMSGFFSKDAILLFMMSTNNNNIIIMLMVLTISMTTMYTLRMVSLSTITETKSKPDTLINNDKFLTWPPYLMLPLSVMMGSILAWYTMPIQNMYLPMSCYLSLLSMMMLGSILSIPSSYKTKKYMIIGKPSIMMWFISTMSANPFKKTSHLGTTLLKKDNSWLELSSAQGIYKLLDSTTILMFTQNKTAMLTTLLAFISPIIIFMNL
uniref:NADH-ubiquinone oxidoreductase chain 5 n=1 Tax=Parachtes teruelis TaxID=1110494 RepID=A0A516IM88_9ARAC|nr:NADH dehydrogenase subunit 5 [Parachtes teruelis]